MSADIHTTKTQDIARKKFGIAITYLVVTNATHDSNDHASKIYCANSQHQKR